MPRIEVPHVICWFQYDFTVPTIPTTSIHYINLLDWFYSLDYTALSILNDYMNNIAIPADYIDFILSFHTVLSSTPMSRINVLCPSRIHDGCTSQGFVWIFVAKSHGLSACIYLFKVSVYGFYHGKSPWNTTILGIFFPTTFSKSKIPNGMRNLYQNASGIREDFFWRSPTKKMNTLLVATVAVMAI